MRRIVFLLVLMLSAACRQTSPGGEMMLTVAPQTSVDLVVTGVDFTWFTPQFCGIKVQLTLRNDGDADSDAFEVSLHDYTQSISGLPAYSETDLIFEVTPEDFLEWTSVTGVIDAGNDILESDEENNAFDYPLPESDTPGQDEISACYLTETTIASWTETAQAPTATYTPSFTPTYTATWTATPTAVKATASPLAPSELPNLRFLSAKNTLLPFNCLEDAEGEFFRVLISNDGNSDVGIFIVRIDDQDYEVEGLAADDEVYLDVTRSGNYVPRDYIEVIIDPNNEIDESKENDNSGGFNIMLLTPPVRCTPTFTPTPA